ncbi:hypothetical protein Golomagni_06263 [Golovinomyces magnicellulatus]|nr:hypothetical protein Golomagni_06263 [Golovinomyces magnicellulatus]
MTTTYIPDAAAGFKDGAAYDAFRSSYTPQAVDGLLTELGVNGITNAKVIDLAAGTGKMTELLAARKEQFQVIAVEPVASMRDTLVAKQLNGVEVREGLADQMNLEDASADALVAAQSFHWFANNDALKEIHRVLQPNGSLGMIWNIEDFNQPREWEPSSPWEGKVKEMILSLDPTGPPRFRENKWWKIFNEGQKYFSIPIGTQRTQATVWLSREALHSRLNTLSHIFILDEARKADFFKKVDEALDGEGTEWNDKKEIAVHTSCFYAWTKKL